MNSRNRPSAEAEAMRCGASCLLAPVALSQGASKQLAPHLCAAILFPRRVQQIEILFLTPP